MKKKTQTSYWNLNKSVIIISHIEFFLVNSTLSMFFLLMTTDIHQLQILHCEQQLEEVSPVDLLVLGTFVDALQQTW